MANANTGFPQGPLTQPDRTPAIVWRQFFLLLWNRTGGAVGSPSLILDTVSDVIGSILYRGSTIWTGLNPGAQFKVLRMGVQFPEWDFLDGNSYGSQAKSNFLASPTAGPGTPAFRTIQTLDLASTAGHYPGTATNDNAEAGQLGEYIFSQVPAGGAVALASGTPSDITTISLTPGDWDVWGNVATAPAGTTTTSAINGWINTASATDPGAPNGGAYAFQRLTIAAGLGQGFAVGMTRISVPAGPNQTVFLSINAAFATSTMAAYGFLGARRAR